MHDMSLLLDLHELEKLHVASYKIEGRLKTARWVSEAVKLARAALSADTNRDELKAQIQALGDYTGRKLSDDFFHGHRDGLTGDSARPSASGMDCGTGRVEDDAPPCLVIAISEDDRSGLKVQLAHGETTDSLRIPPQRIANPRRAVTLSDILADVPAAMPKNEPTPIVNVPKELEERLLPKSIRNNFLDAITAFFRRKAKEGDGVVRNIGLPQAVRQLLEAKPASCPNNSRKLGDKPTHARIDFTQLENAVKAIVEPLIVNVCPMVENEAADIVEAVKRHIRRIHAVALPDVIYEHQVPVIRELLKRLSNCGVAIEVNSWDTWWLAKEASVTMEAGPGLAVLNATAAEMLHCLGCRSVSVSPEIDKGQLEDLCSAVSVPLSITVFSRPKLMQTRAILPEGFRPEDNAKFDDARHIALKPEKCGEITALRPTVPLDWRSLRNPSVHAAMLVTDLSACRNLEMPRTDKPFLFNYDRRLR